MSIYEHLGLGRVINASGRMTALGASTLAPEVVMAMAEGATTYVDIAQLKIRAGARIAALCGAEDAVVTAGAAAGIVTMVAATVAGTDAGRVRALPNADWPRRQIVLQAGHQVNFGADVAQMVRIGGGEPLVVGAANAVGRDTLVAAIGERTAAILYIQSHHAIQKGMIGLEEVIAIGHASDVPVLVDAAAEEDLGRYIALGADLVAYSGGKAIEGPTSGFVAGRRDLVAACRSQEAGVARPMKVGKEAIAGLVAAVEAYANRDDRAQRAIWDGYLEIMRSGLATLDAITVSVDADEAGRAIRRLALRVRDAAPFGLSDLVSDLGAGTPPVILRDHHLREGVVHLDPRPLAPGDAEIVVEQVRRAVAGRLGVKA